MSLAIKESQGWPTHQFSTSTASPSSSSTSTWPSTAWSPASRWRQGEEDLVQGAEENADLGDEAGDEQGSRRLPLGWHDIEAL